MFLLPLLWACAPDDPNLYDALDSDQVRAGIVDTPEALYGGISAEGQLGDIKMYNSRSRWIIQGLRPGSFYISQGGTPIDADIVRPKNQPGRDIVDEWGGMFGMGRLTDPQKIEILSNGVEDDVAHVRVTGIESPMELVTGALEADIIANKGLELVTDYRLKPDSPFLQVTTQITATTQAASITVGDMIMGSLEASDLWVPGHGLDHGSAEEWPWIGYAGRRNDIALGIFSDETDGVLDASGGAELLLELATLAIAMDEAIELEPGESFTFSRFYGVGADLAELSDAWLDHLGIPTEVISGTVEADDGPVGGARVNILVDEAPFTLAFTNENGEFEAKIPKDSAVTLLAEGRGPGAHVDLPVGYAPYSPYGATTAKAQALAAFESGASSPPLAEGRGVASDTSPLKLQTPAELTLIASDGLPFTAKLSPLDETATPDPRLVMNRLLDWGEGAWSTDGEIHFPAHPGRYELLVYRGLRWEAHSEEITLEEGQRLSVDVNLEAAYELDDWLIGDPHTHASPSGDGSIPMADRLIVAAATGVQIHFGTDHDHVADYRPLLAPLGLEEHLASIVADEVSPVLRGHRNVYPIEPKADAPNGGAWPWWSARVNSTEEGFAYLRESYPDAVIQLNHPTGGGVGDAADWSPGEIGSGNRWTENFDAVEVLNSYEHEEFFEFYADITNRGIQSTPIGVSDSHGYFSGGPGLNVTFFNVGHSDPMKLTNDELKTAITDAAVVISMGPFLETSPLPGSTISGSTTLNVAIKAPTWVPISRLDLLKNGEVENSIDAPDLDAIHSFELEPEQDAWYVVIATGEESMQPVSDRIPWAMTSPIRIDVDGQGWSAPLPPLTVAP